MLQEIKLKYFIYLRKSSDTEDRQVQSIETQERELTEYANKHGLEIVDTFRETKSAFKPGREQFELMIKRFSKGEANGLLVLQANRISRNAIDGAQIINLLDTEYLSEVRTPVTRYGNSSTEKMMLAFEFIFSKKDSDDKSTFVKGGMKTKSIKGYPHGMAKVGYTNDQTEEKGNRSWLKDELRFPLVKQCFQMLLTKKYSVKQVYEFARDELHLTTPLRKNEGGRPIAYSYWYVMFADPIYAGFFFDNGVRYELNSSLERVISEEEYWEIQTMLGKKGRPKPQKRVALYNHFMRCEECNGAVTPDFKFQIICPECKKKFSYLNREDCPKCGCEIENMKNPTYLSYIYYYCVSHKKFQTCSKGGIVQDNLETELFDDISENMQISKELSDWCIQNVDELQDQELEEAITLARIRENEEQEIQKKLRNLLDLRISRDDISAEERSMFDLKERELREKLKEVQEKNKVKTIDLDWKKKATKNFSLMTEVFDILENGSFEEKKDILSEIGSNLKLCGKNLSISYADEINVFIEALKEAKLKNPQFEPKISLANKDKTEVFTSVCPTLLRG